MKDDTKIILSAKELELVCNTEWILTKQIVIQKVYDTFGTAAAVMQQQLAAANPALGAITSPKISKGEYYRKLPYVILDYPRLFTKADTAAIRTFFWWGNFCSVCLHLAGEYKIKSEQLLLAQHSFFSTNNYFICIADTEWEHHFEEDNFIGVSAMSFTEFSSVVQGKSFVKIAKKIPLTEWENMHAFILESFEQLLPFL